jgi:hypothetical protein
VLLAHWFTDAAAGLTLGLAAERGMRLFQANLLKEKRRLDGLKLKKGPDQVEAFFFTSQGYIRPTPQKLSY